MIFAGLAPWQVLVWLMGLELLSAPIIIFTVNAISIGFFRAKEQHTARMLASFGKMLETMGGKLDKIKEEIGDVNKADS